MRRFRTGFLRMDSSRRAVRDRVVTPHFPALQRALEAAKAQHRSGRFAEARRAYRRILDRHPEHAPALHYLGVLEHMQGNSTTGLELVQRAHRLDPASYDIRKNLGNLLLDLNRAKEAEALCLEVLKEQPGDAGNHVNYSVCLRKLGRHAEAVAAGQEALKLEPENVLAMLALANALACTDELEQAAKAYEQVLARQPTFSPAHNSLCRVLLQIEQSGIISRRRLSRTRKAYQRWATAVPANPTAQFLLDALNRRTPPSRMPDNVVRASFDTYADSFDKHIRSLHYCAPELIAQVLAQRLPPASAGLDVLDGGCGTGLAARMLRPHARRLTGVDLSPEMLRHARATTCYDTLAESELGSWLDQHPATYDLCVFIDVLIYFGDLHAILHAASQAIRPGGLLAFSVEKSSQPGSHLHTTGRYSHHPDHVLDALAGAGLTAIEHQEASLRNEANSPVAGLLVSARKHS